MATKVVCTFLLLVAIAVVNGANNSGYQGCMAFPDGYDIVRMGDFVYSADSIVVDMCQKTCHAYNRIYAFVFNGTTCACGNGEFSLGSSGCNLRDSWGSEAGGSAAASAYRSGAGFATWASRMCIDNLVFSSSISQTSSSNSPQQCADFCATNKYTWASLQGNECTCGNNLASWGSFSDLTGSSTCGAIKCPGLPTAGCGGPNTAHVLLTGYWGCKTDNPARVLSTTVSLPSNTIENCQQACFDRGFDFAGLQYSSQCFCGNMGSVSMGDDAGATCNMQCSGSLSTCGGSWANSVYGADNMLARSVSYTTLPSGYKVIHNIFGN